MTYKMDVKCLNCSTEFSADIEKGHEARYHGECPYCGMKWYWNFKLSKPIDISTIQDDAMRSVMDKWGIKKEPTQ